MLKILSGAFLMWFLLFGFYSPSSIAAGCFPDGHSCYNAIVVNTCEKCCSGCYLGLGKCVPADKCKSGDPFVKHVK